MRKNREMRKNILVLHQSGPEKSDVDEVLGTFGYQVDSTSEETAAFDILKSDLRPHLLLIEASPQEKGFISFLKELRSDPALEKIPVIALMERDELGTAAGVLDAGCDAFLLKPVDPRILYQRVQKLLEKTPRAYNRVLCRIVAEATSGQEVLTGEMVEICEGGAGLLLDRKQAERDILKLAFVFPQDTAELIVGVEVIHVEKCGDQYLHGVRFIIIDRLVKEKIRQFVKAAVSTGES
jgi:DNA-binding response OmpR family regulator